MRTSTSVVEQKAIRESCSEPFMPSPAARAEVRPRGLGWPAAAAGTVTAVFLLSNSATPLYAYWQARWDFGSGTLTVIFATYMVGLIAALLVGGRMADRFGRKAVLVPGLSSALVASLLFFSAQNVVWLLAARLLAGAAVGAAVTAGMAAIVDLAPGPRKQTGSLIASVSMVFGAGLGPLLAGGLAALGSGFPQRTVFGVVAGVQVLALVVALVLPLESPRRPVDSRLMVWPSAPKANRRELRRGIAAFAPGITATSFVLSMGPTVLRSVEAPGTFVAGAVACAMFLVATGVQFALARLTTRAHLALSSILTILAMFTLALSVTAAPVVVLVVAAALLAGAAQGLGQLAGLSLIATRVPAEKRAESNAVLNIGGYIPAGVLSVGVGYAADAFGLSTAVTFFAALLTLVAVMAAISTTTSGSTKP